MTCSHNEEALILYFYDELDEIERAEVDARLRLCPSCQDAWAGMQHLEQAIPRTPALEPEEATLMALRRELRVRLPRHTSWRAAWMERFDAFRNALRWSPFQPALRLALAVVLVGLGFWLGRQGGVQAGPDLESLLLATQPLQAENGTVNPFFAGVDAVQFDPVTGLVEVRYQTLNEVALRGRPDDRNIRHLLQQALLDQDNPTARLYAARALQGAPTPQTAPDAETVQALLLLLDEEPNEGIRLYALQALRKLHQQAPYGEAVKQTLLTVLLNDDNSALRIEALQMLTESPLAAPDLGPYLNAVRNDPNDYIRLQAITLLEQLDASKPLEQMP